MDWFLNENNTLTLSGIYDWESHIDTAQVPYMNMITGKRYRMWHWNEEENTGYMNYALDFNHKFAQPGHELDARVQYTKGWEDESYFLNDSSSIRQGKDATHILATEHTTNITVDYIKPLPSGRLEAGTKFEWRRLPVEYTVTPGENSIIYSGMDDWSDWGEDIYAAYLNYVYEKPKFDIEGGLRAENTSVFYDIAPENIYYPKNDSYQYFELFPNIRLTYKLNERNNISAFYNRRIDRPGEPELRIFPKYDDPELLKVGNPYLRPQFTQTFELAYKTRWENGSVFLSGYYRMIDAYQVTWYFPYQRPFSIEASSDKTWDFKINNQVVFPWDFEFQLTGVYYAPKDIPQGRQLARSSVDFGIKKGMLDGRGELTFSFSDIFNNFGLRQEIVEQGFIALYENYYETQVARIGFKYKF